MSQVSLRGNGTGVPDQSLAPSRRKQRRLALLEHSTHRDEHSAAGKDFPAAEPTLGVHCVRKGTGVYYASSRNTNSKLQLNGGSNGSLSLAGGIHL
jgi:hypothetical protein